ncbi:MAG TPA: DUF2461 domain-containing protein [Acidimicrobiales bacterium]|nr:DUF2461 domain-containing protein [Acidimicrobiales bacterium]
MSPDRFRGWPVEAVEYFEGLEADNSKTYWTEHKSLYEAKVRAPMEALLAELQPEFGEGRIYRPYRDVRFTADKSPYKTHLAAHNAGGYFQLNSEALGVGTGMYMPAPDQLERYRAAVADDRSGGELVRIVGGLRKKAIDVDAHEVLKTAPKGYPKDHPRIDLLRQKGITAWKQWPVGAWLGTAAAKKRIVDFLTVTAPLREWLDEHTVS